MYNIQPAGKISKIECKQNNNFFLVKKVATNNVLLSY